MSVYNITSVSNSYGDTVLGKLRIPVIMVDAPLTTGTIHTLQIRAAVTMGAPLERNGSTITSPMNDDHHYKFSGADTAYIVKGGNTILLYVDSFPSLTISLSSEHSTCGYIVVTDGSNFHTIPIGQKISDTTQYSEYIAPTSTSYGYVIFNNKNIDFECSANSFLQGQALVNYLVGASFDPYNKAGNSGTGGGGGTFDGSSDPVPIPNLPPIGATDTGFISLFVPTMAQLNQVSSYLWSNFFDLATFKKIFEDPMDCILGLSVVPLTIPTSGNAQITVGNVELSGITLPLASQQYVELDCGTVDFTKKYFGSYLDQDPYTKMALFVPYSGVHAVNSDDIMGKVIGLKYHIDILTGSLVAFVMCGNSVLYEFNGACASNIPVNSINYASTIENAIRIAVNIGTTVATAGASAPMTGVEAAGREAARTFGTAVNMAGSTADGILSLKPNIDRTGSLGGTTGLMGNQIPYFIITRPRLCKPKDQNKIKGYPSFIEATVSELEGNGYTEFDSIILEGLYLTNAEKEELLTILKSGVYL